VRGVRVWARLLGVERTVVEDVGFDVVQWATAALDEVRREVWNVARRTGLRAEARSVKGARFGLRKNPEDLTARQQATLAQIAETNEPLYRAYLLKEQLRQALKLPVDEALALLERWLSWAHRSRLPAFVRLAQQIRAHLSGIAAALGFGLSNARTKSVNTRIRLIARRAFGFHSPEALIALALLSLGLCPPLPRPRRLSSPTQPGRPPSTGVAPPCPPVKRSALGPAGRPPGDRRRRLPLIAKEIGTTPRRLVTNVESSQRSGGA
jgi:UDP:flavonoid glycosyltransferase YjiC (YdhE family)